MARYHSNAYQSAVDSLDWLRRENDKLQKRVRELEEIIKELKAQKTTENESEKLTS